MSFATLTCTMALGRIAFTLAGTSLRTAFAVFAALAFALIFSGHVVSP
jgi:hypothetical protein